MDQRFSRFEAMIGAEALEALRHSHILVLGVGGVGGGAVEALARSGVGRLTLVDDDDVDITNLNRQFAALSSNIGMDKVSAMAMRVRDINPDCIVEEKCIRFTEETAEEILSGDIDYVADCIDDMNAKVLLVKLCREKRIPLIASMGAGNRMDPSKLYITDIFKTENDPVARIMRTRLRKEGISKLTVVASHELPQKCRVETAPGRFSPASSPFVPPVAGMLIASHIVNVIVNQNAVNKCL